MLVGLDVGTSGLKAIAVDPESGEVRATATHEYPLHTPRPGWAEQDGADFLSATEKALAEIASALGEDAKRVIGIGLSGQMHSAMLLDEKRQLVRRAILWCDTRTTDACRTITDRLGTAGLAETVGNAALEGFTLPKLVWLKRHEPEVYARVCSVVMPKDYVALALTGELGTEVSDASGTLAFEPGNKRWSPTVLDALEISRSLFPDVGESTSLAGALRPALAERVGLPAGIPVARGAADNAAGAVGLGVVRPGIGMASVGTSGVIFAPTPRFEVDRQLRLHSFCHAVPGRYYVMGVMLAAGGALRWYRDVLCAEAMTEAKRTGGDPYERIVADAERAAVGAGGLIFLPYIMGERTPHNDANARASFVGMTARTTKSDFSRSVIEGITFGLADSIELMRSLDNPPELRELRVTGGGAKSPFWRQLMADVFGLTISTTSSTEGPAFGAAMLGGVAAGVFDDVDQAADSLVEVIDRVEPDQERHERYAEVHVIYRRLYDDLSARFSDLAASSEAESGLSE